jgi:hypothetical protein
MPAPALPVTEFVPPAPPATELVLLALPPDDVALAELDTSEVPVVPALVRASPLADPLLSHPTVSIAGMIINAETSLICPFPMQLGLLVI